MSSTILRVEPQSTAQRCYPLAPRPEHEGDGDGEQWYHIAPPSDTEREDLHEQWRASALDMSNDMTEVARLCLHGAELVNIINPYPSNFPAGARRMHSPSTDPETYSAFPVTYERRPVNVPRLSSTASGSAPRYLLKDDPVSPPPARSTVLPPATPGSLPRYVLKDDPVPLSPAARCTVLARSPSPQVPDVFVSLEEDEKEVLASSATSSGSLTPRQQSPKALRTETVEGYVVVDNESVKSNKTQSTIKADRSSHRRLKRAASVVSMSASISSSLRTKWGRFRKRPSILEGLESVDSGSEADTTFGTPSKVQFGAVPRPQPVSPRIRRTPTGPVRKSSQNKSGLRHRLRHSLPLLDVTNPFKATNKTG